MEAKVATVEAKVATYLQPAAPQRTSGSNKGARHRGGLPPIQAVDLSDIVITHPDTVPESQ